MSMAIKDNQTDVLVPSVRFKGFTEDWEQRKFNDIVKRLSKTSDSNEIPKVEFEDIIAGEGRLNKDVSKKFDNRKGIIFNRNNILYGKLRPYLKNWLLTDFEGIALGDFWVFESKGSEPDFVYSLIQAGKYQKVANDTSGTKMPRSDWKRVSTTPFLVPNFNEQTKIGQLFRELDNTIALHQRALDLLKQRKKAFLQKMFPKKGENVPIIRFSIYSNNWDQMHLDELTTKNNVKNKKRIYNNVESISNKYGFINQSDQFDRSVASINTSNYYVIQPKTFAYNPSRINVGSLAYKSKNEKISIVSPLYVTFSTTDLINDEFLLYWLRTIEFNRQRYIYSEGSVRDTLSYDSFSSISIKFPSLEEQEKIGNFFKELDKSIVLKEEKIELLKQMKEAFLQKMFV